MRRKMSKVKETTNDEIIIFNVKGKKNNQTSVSNADLEIPTLGSTDNAGNEVKPRFRHYPFTLGLVFLGLHRRQVLDSICPDISLQTLNYPAK